MECSKHLSAGWIIRKVDEMKFVKTKRTQKYINMAFLWIMGAIFLLPLFWMISTSLKPDDQIMSVPAVWWPSPMKLSNYIEAVRAFPFVRYFFNTAFIAIAKVGGTLLTAALAGYAFAKLTWRGRDAIFFITIATMFIPGQVLLVPMYILFSKVGWINT